jgi:hypothetical protein
LPVLLDVLERDIRAFTASKLKMSEVYVGVLRKLQAKATFELAYANRQTNKLGIRIHSEARTKSGLKAQYNCRGYQHDIHMLWDLVKAEIEVRLAAYLRINLDGPLEGYS